MEKEDIPATVNLSRALSRGGRYENPWPTWQARSFLDAFKWGLKRKPPQIPPREELDRELPVRAPDWDLINAPRRSSPATGSGDEAEEAHATSTSCIQATWVGHSTFLVQMEGVNFLTDPVWADRCSPLDSVGIGPKRYRPVPFQLRELPHIDFVVVSHNHYDHLDISVVKGLSEKTKWYVPIGLRAWFERCGVNNVEELYWWDSAEFVKPASGEGADEGETRITVTATPCQHWSMRNGLDRCKSLWNSWAVTGASNRVWFAGDTGYCSAFKEIGDNLGPFNLGLIPIGAYCPRDFMQPQHIDPEEAVQIHKDIKAHTSIGMHWGTFILTDEPILEPREKMEELVRLKNLRDDEFITIHHGETKVFATSSFAGDQCDEQLACKERETI